MSETRALEELPPQLEAVEEVDFFAVLHRIKIWGEVEFGKDATKLILVPGFEDVLGEPLGAGQFYNHSGCVQQLAFSLAVTPNPAVAEMIEGISIWETKPLDTIIELRERQVLAGMRILDLGCGLRPGFAAAAKALGGEVCTADIEDLDDFYKTYLNGHAVVDLTAPDAADVIRENVGGDFDIITEHIVGGVPGHPWVRGPETADLITISEALLARGGYLFATTVRGLRDNTIRKL